MPEEITLLSQEELLKGIKKVNRVKQQKPQKNASSSSKKKSVSHNSQKRTAKKV